MSKRILSAALASLLILTNCFAQTTSTKPASSETPPKLTRADFENVQPVKVDLEKESYKSQTRKNNFSSAAKTALWIGLIAAGVVTIVVLATRNNNEDNSPCSVGTAQIGVPCPPGCVCIQ